VADIHNLFVVVVDNIVVVEFFENLQIVDVG